jgi:hypothetical protein
MITELSKLKTSSAVLKKRRHWPSRPLPILPELREFGVGIPRTEKLGSSNPVPAVPQQQQQQQQQQQHRSNSVVLQQQPENRAPVAIYKSPDPDSLSPNPDPPSKVITVRPKRLVQAPDYYRRPQGSIQLEKKQFVST